MPIIKLYRAVSPQELADIMALSEFRPAPPSNRGKWFAESANDAAEWGRQLYGSTPFHLVAVVLPLDIADGFFRLRRLDGIGPARFAGIHELPVPNVGIVGPILEVQIP
jgi:hypothetical protein